MTDNPLDEDARRQQRVSERAYHLWQSEGELQGHDGEYWERAEELIGMEDSAGSGQLPNPMSVPGNDPSRPPMVEEAFIQENLGEFPGQTDQGEHLHTPNVAASHENDDAVPSATLGDVGAGKGHGISAAASGSVTVEPVEGKKKTANTGKTAAKIEQGNEVTETALVKAKGSKRKQ